MKRLLQPIVYLLIFPMIMTAQTWHRVSVGTWGNWSPMIEVDNDGYVHLANERKYATTWAQDPASLPDGSIATIFSAQIPLDLDGNPGSAAFPSMRLRNGKAHIAFRTGNLNVGYWTPSFGQMQIETYIEGYHSHQTAIEVSSDGTKHLWIQQDGDPDGINIMYQRSNSNAIIKMMKDGLGAESGLYDYGTAIDNNDELHWLGAAYVPDMGAGRKFYYNHTTSGQWQTEATRLNWEGGYPSMAVDSNNVIHVVWQNSVIKYSYRDENGWHEPVTISDPGEPTQQWWVHQQVNSLNLKSIRAVENHKEYAWTCGVGGIFMTDDYWETFDVQYVDNSVTIKAVFPVDTQYVFCVGNNGTFWKTRTGGDLLPSGEDGWEELSTGFTIDLYDCWFSDTLNGIAVGNAGTIIKTTDGGESWTEVRTGDERLREIDFPTANVGYIAANNGVVLKTTDSGKNWTEMNTSIDRNFLAIDAVDENTVWVTGPNGTVGNTFDGGATWESTSLYYLGLKKGFAISFISDSVGFVSGTRSENDHYIFKTTDAGATWQRTKPLTGYSESGALHGMYFISEDLGFVCGGDGRVYKGIIGTDAEYFQPGIAIDRKGNIHVAYWGWQSSAHMYRHIYYTNKINGTWADEQQIATNTYMPQVDGGTKIDFDYRTNTIYVSGLTVLNGFLIYTRDIPIREINDNETTTIVSSSQLNEPEVISTDIDDENEALNVFDFTITDAGDDGLPTIISDLNIRKGPNGTQSLSYSESLTNAKLIWADDSLYANTIGRDYIAFDFSSKGDLVVPNNGSVILTLKIWLESNQQYSDDTFYDFKISAAHDVHIKENSSGMTTEPSDITSGGIRIKLIPEKFIINGLPEAVIYGSDYSFIDPFTVTAVDSMGQAVVTAECNDLTLTAVGEDSVAPVNGTVTFDPSGQQSLTNGIAQYNYIIFSEGRQEVRIKAEGTIDGETIVGYSDLIHILPSANTDILILFSNMNELHTSSFLSKSFNRLGKAYDAWNLDAFRSDTIPANFLNEYPMIFINESNISPRNQDTISVNTYLQEATVQAPHNLALFGNSNFGMNGIRPACKGLGAYLGIGPLSIYPINYDMVEGETIYGTPEDPIGNGLEVNLSDQANWGTYPMSPLPDSTNIRTVLSSTIEGDSSYLAPVGIRHNGNNYKTFRTGFSIYDYGNDQNVDSLVSRIIQWFHDDTEENFGYPPYFTNSLWENPWDLITINDTTLFTYTAHFNDYDQTDNLSAELVDGPDWLTAHSESDSITVSGLPNYTDGAFSIFVLKVSDARDNYFLQTTRLKINHINIPPQIVETTPDTAFVNHPYNYPIQISDPDTALGDDHTFSITNVNRSWLEINTQGILFGTPSISDTGKTEAEVVVMDSYGKTDTTIVEIPVATLENNLPQLNEIATQVIPEDSSLSIVIKASDADNDSLNLWAVSDTTEVTPSIQNDSLLVTSVIPNWYGDCIITLFTADPYDTVSTSFSLVVKPVNDPPVIEGIMDISIKEDSSAQTVLHAVDIDNSELIFSAISDTSAVKLSITQDSVLTIEPITNWYGNAQIMVTVSDTSLSDTTDFYLHVLDRNNAPQIRTIVDTSMAEDDTMNVSIAINDPDSDMLTFEFNTHDSISIVLIDSMLRIIPVPNWFGESDIQIVTSDGELTDTTQFKLSVLPVNDPPEQFQLISPENDATITINSNDTLQFRWEESSDIDGDKITYNMLFKGKLDNLSLNPTQYHFIDIPFEEISHTIDTLKHIQNTWTVTATDSIDTVYAANGWFNITIENTQTGIWSANKPDHYELYQNHPNPFNPRTTIPYAIPQKSRIKIQIYNILGEKITTLVNDQKEPGSYQLIWDARDNQGNSVTSGVYIYLIQARSPNRHFMQSRKMIFLK